MARLGAMGCSEVPDDETDASVRIEPMAATAEDCSVLTASPERSLCSGGLRDDEATACSPPGLCVGRVVAMTYDLASAYVQTCRLITSIRPPCHVPPMGPSPRDAGPVYGTSK
ncbi:hypothetical protein L1887_57958 [Cichorium endivia]|nr:hypothetical protein L1887_57958 [Cichorium endivia]